MKTVFAFHGADSKSGVTMIAQSVSEYIADEIQGKDVLFLTLTGKLNTEFIKRAVSPIDRYRINIESGIGISKCEVDRLEGYRNLYAISGVKDETEERLYMPDTAVKLINDMKRSFDIIIADCGSRLDNGLAIGGLMEADVRYMVISQNEATIKRYEDMRELYKKLSVDFEETIINKYSERDPYKDTYIRKRLGIEGKKIFTVSFTGLGRRAEMEYRTIRDMGDEAFLQDIRDIADNIAGEAGISAADAKNRKNGKILFRRLHK